MSDNSSENSLVKGESDFGAKYSRLASEYSKVRAQNAVLKKAVLDEQTKNVQLNEILREKDQVIRKSNQEMESLNFRNSQLSRRVIVLQEEIDVMNKNSKKKFKNVDIANGTVENPILNEEIKKTMIENAKLISELNEKDERHVEEVFRLNKELHSLNSELDRCNLKIKQMHSQHLLTIEQMKNEQLDFKRDYATKVNKLKEIEIELSTLKMAHKEYVNEIGPKLENVSQFLTKNVPFNDKGITELNKLNIQHSLNGNDDRSDTELQQNHFTALILTFYNLIHNVTVAFKSMGFEEFRIYIKTLLKEDDGLLFSEKLNSCYRLLQNIESDNSQDSIEHSVKEFMKSFLDFCLSVCHCYMNKSKIMSPADNISNITVKDAFECLQKKKYELLQKIINLPNSEQVLLMEEFENMDTAMKNLITDMNHINEKRAHLANQKSAEPCDIEIRACNYPQPLNKEEKERIPYAEAIENKKKLQEYIMLNNILQDEIRNLEKNVTSLEQEKVHLLNELDVLRVKSDNRVIEIPPEESNEIKETIKELGKITLADGIPSEILNREKEIQRYLNKKMDEIIIMKEEASSRARTFMLECNALRRRLENCAVEKRLLKNKYNEVNKSTLELREELSTVSQNYEIQLRMMSEHLASVNEKLALQSEEIDNLKYQLSNKIMKRGKQK